jgi:hypothetical protein
MKKRPIYVYVVTYRYPYEGESLEGVYATYKLALSHPGGYGESLIYKVRVQVKAVPKIPTLKSPEPITKPRMKKKKTQKSISAP